MAELESSDGLESILKLLDLKQYYPEKLSRDDLYQITFDSLANPDEKSNSPAARQFINNITRYNYHARNIQSNDTSTQQPSSSGYMGFRERTRLKREQDRASIHPLEVIAALYLCCDPTARQDLVMHLWGCRLAVPLVFQLTKDTKPRIYLWPLRGLIAQFKVENGILEMPMVNKLMKSIAMMRLGENEMSKSYLLNCLIDGPDKSHPIFFHRNCEGSKRKQNRTPECITEVGWYLTTESCLGKFDGPRLFINVRGNVEHYKQQRKLIGQLATVTVLLTTLSHLKSSVSIIRALLGHRSRVILVLSDPKSDEELIEEFLDANFQGIPDTEFDVVVTEGYVLSDILGTITSIIKKQEHESDKEVSLSDFVKNLSSMEYDVDEAQPQYVGAFETTNDIVQRIRKINDIDRKKMILPLQENYWKSWSDTDRDYWRYDQLDQSDKKTLGSKESLELKLRKLRNDQYRCFKQQGLSKVMSVFIESLFSFRTLQRKIFLRMLKLALDQLSRKELLPLDREYQKLINVTINACEADRAKINQKLADIDELKITISFGLEHMIREIGQLFEACESQREDEIYVGKKGLHYRDLPLLASFLMMEGYPVEILDGEACSVPLLWVKSVLQSLSLVLQKNNDKQVKVHVVSVLGIQSSGKSTFLNTIFGLQFAVSAGRCTRGAFMQGVKVHSSMKGKIDADYILAIDTEGLRAAELLSDDSRKHDNELSTFVIGLADTTVINLMGENATYLQENLPIAVHAFLRMNLAGLHPRCTIVHHNVDKRNKEKLLTQGRILESVLNNLTNKACELEKIPHKMFHDIIEFSILKHTDYIPSLFEGEQPMAPVSVGYSKEAEHVRRKIIDFANTDTECCTLPDFARHIETLWNAIKKDRFVYEFRTTLEAEARLELDQKYFAILRKYLTELDNIVDSLIPKLTTKTKHTFQNLEKKFKDSITPIEKKCKGELERFLTKPNRRVATCYEQWKQKYLCNLGEEMAHYLNSAIQQLKDYNERLHLSVSMDTIEHFFDFLRRESLTLKRSEAECFDTAWEKWKHNFNLTVEDISVLRDTHKALQDVCPMHKHLLAEIKNETIHTFRPSLDVHLNRPRLKINDNTLLELMYSIIVSVAEEYTRELIGIDSRKMTYTDRYPKQILLRVSDHLSLRLKNEDKENEIANQFQIDLLKCVAGTIVKEFERSIGNDPKLLDIKEEMRKTHCNIYQRITLNNSKLVEIILDNLNKKIKSAFHTFAPKCVLSVLETSKWSNHIASKQALFGFCLFHIIVYNNDKMLSVYVNSPKRAVFQYLQLILNDVFEENDFHSILAKFVWEISNQITVALEQESGKELLPFGEMSEKLFTVLELNENLEQLERYKIQKYKKETVNLCAVKSLFEHTLDESINVWTKSLEKEIRKNKDVIVSVCADKLCKLLVGCENVCPVCSEICKYSVSHQNIIKHECFLHRPVGCRGYHRVGTDELSFKTCTQHYELNNWFRYSGRFYHFQQFEEIYPDWLLQTADQRQPSVIWKWIFVNKFHILEKSRFFNLPKNLPECWKEISQKEVLRAIQQQFKL